MRSFDDLVAGAEAADVTGWGFHWLDGRAVEERPPWHYSRILGHRLSRATSALDLDTGGGEVLAEASEFPPRMVATESLPPNVMKARQLLGPRGVEVIEARADMLPLSNESFDLVTARHPVRPDWPEIRRVLQPGGFYLAQHVGPSSAFELIEHFLGPLSRERQGRDPIQESSAAQDAGLTVTHLRTARCRMEFYDVGAIVWILRKCVWWVPEFSADKFRVQLAELDGRMRAGTPITAHSTRHLFEAQRPADGPDVK